MSPTRRCAALLIAVIVLAEVMTARLPRKPPAHAPAEDARAMADAALAAELSRIDVVSSWGGLGVGQSASVVIRRSGDGVFRMDSQCE